MSPSRRVLTFLTALTIAAGLGLVHPGAAQAAAEEVYLTNVHSGKAMTVLNGRTYNNQPVVQWTSNQALPDNDKIRLVPLTGNEYFLQAVHSGRCLVVKNASFALYARIIQFDCTRYDTYANDIWLSELVPVRIGTQDYKVPQFRNRDTGLCIHVLNASLANGAELVQYTCNQSRNSLWRSFYNASTP
jgi:hypothetical protein